MVFHFVFSKLLILSKIIMYYTRVSNTRHNIIILISKHFNLYSLGKLYIFFYHLTAKITVRIYYLIIFYIQITLSLNRTRIYFKYSKYIPKSSRFASSLVCSFWIVGVNLNILNQKKLYRRTMNVTRSIYG